jgi:predicted RNA-binding Zn-ribbon protein involved in translation (DUF1610 family)
MKKTCPSCNKNFTKSFIKSKNLTPEEAIKTKDIVYICPYCKTAVVTNMHESKKSTKTY